MVEWTFYWSRIVFNSPTSHQNNNPNPLPLADPGAFWWVCNNLVGFSQHHLVSQILQAPSLTKHRIIQFSHFPETPKNNATE